jgi:hypothetical protein
MLNVYQVQSERLITTESYEWSQKKELARTVVDQTTRIDHFARVSAFASSNDHLADSTLPDVLDEIGYNIVTLETAFSEYGSSSISIGAAKNIYSSLLGNIDLDIFPNQASFTFTEFLQYYSKLAKFKKNEQGIIATPTTLPPEDSSGKIGISSSSATGPSASSTSAYHHQNIERGVLPRLNDKISSTDQSSSELTVDEVRRRRIEKLQFPTIFSTGIVDSRRPLTSPSIPFIQEKKVNFLKEIESCSMGSDSSVLFVPLSGTDNIRKASRAEVLETIQFWEKVHHIYATKDGEKQLKRVGGRFSISR